MVGPNGCSIGGFREQARAGPGGAGKSRGSPEITPNLRALLLHELFRPTGAFGPHSALSQSPCGQVPPTGRRGGDSGAPKGVCLPGPPWPVSRGNGKVGSEAGQRDQDRGYG